jgi:hypothetical protein
MPKKEIFFYNMYNITKKNTEENTFFKKIDNNLNFIFRDKEYSFWFVTLIHNFFLISIFLSIILFNKKTFKFKLAILFFIFYFLFFYISNGDPIINLERFILKNNSWFGIYESLELFNIPKTKRNINFTFFSLTIIFYYIIIFKIFIMK